MLSFAVSGVISHSGGKKKEGEENAVVYSLEYCRGSIAQGTFVSNNGLDSVGVEAVAKKVLVCMDLSHRPYVALGPPAKPPTLFLLYILSGGPIWTDFQAFQRGFSVMT